MKPRDSIPQTRSKVFGSTAFAISSIVDRRPLALCRRGVMSLKRIPFFGKSGTSRMYDSIKDISGGDENASRGESRGRRPGSEERGCSLRARSHFLRSRDAEQTPPVGDRDLGGADELKPGGGHGRFLPEDAVTCVPIVHLAG